MTCATYLCTKTLVDGKALTLPFGRHRGLYMWDVAVAPTKASPTPPTKSGRTCSLGSVLKSGIHAAGAHSHVRTLPADDVAAILHRRLHLGLGLLKRLGGRTDDAPSHLASATEVTCPHCVAANGHRLAHSSSQYHSSHAGRLVHADIAGPFRRSWLGGFQYALVLTDDHTRFKFIYFLKAKSEAPDRVRRFIASFNALANLRSDAVVRVVSTIHTDNAGEFLSRQFQELMDESLVSQTTCPPHVHQLNGVAERSILAVCSLARSYFAASSVAVTYWPFAFQMAVDVLEPSHRASRQRSRGPLLLRAPHRREAARDEHPPLRVQSLRGEASQPVFEDHHRPARVGRRQPGPQRPLARRLRDLRAWHRPHSDDLRRVFPGVAVPVPTTRSADGRLGAGHALARRRPTTRSRQACLPRHPSRTRHRADSDALSDADTLEDEGEALRASGRTGSRGWAKRAAAYTAAIGRALDDAARDVLGLRTPLPRRVLVLFSGPYARPDGLTAFLRARGIEVDQYDCDAKHGGGDDANILNDAFFTSLFNLVRNGHYAAVFTAPPCSTYSVARHFPADRPGRDSGPPVVRTRSRSSAPRMCRRDTSGSCAGRTRSPGARRSSSPPPSAQALSSS